MNVPDESLNAINQASLAARWGSANLAAYLRYLVARRTDRSGAICLKLHWAQLIQCHGRSMQPRPETSIPADVGSQRRERYRFLAETFPNPRFIHIARRHRIRQAVSWYVAAYTGEWTRTAETASDARPLPPFDLDRFVRRPDTKSPAKCKTSAALFSQTWAPPKLPLR